MGCDIDLFFKRNYEHVIKDHCPGILSYSSTGRKSIKMSTSAGKKEHLFYRTPPNGCLLIFIKIVKYKVFVFNF